jgi:hypothetical protein
MQKSFRRGRLLLCHTTATAVRIVYSVQFMVGIVTNNATTKGGSRRAVLAAIGLMRFYRGLRADCRLCSNFADYTL